MMKYIKLAIAAIYLAEYVMWRKPTNDAPHNTMATKDMRKSGIFYVDEDDYCGLSKDGIYFSISGKPVPQKRDRSNRNGNRYNPSKRQQQQFKECCKNLFLSHTGKQPPKFDANQALKLSLVYYLRHPKNGRPDVLNRCSQADLDNLNKFTLDAMVGLFYADDVQVTELITKKSYHPDSPHGRVVVKLEKTTLDTSFIECRK